MSLHVYSDKKFQHRNCHHCQGAAFLSVSDSLERCKGKRDLGYDMNFETVCIMINNFFQIGRYFIGMTVSQNNIDKESKYNL